MTFFEKFSQPIVRTLALCTTLTGQATALPLDTGQTSGFPIVMELDGTLLPDPACPDCKASLKVSDSDPELARLTTEMISFSGNVYVDVVFDDGSRRRAAARPHVEMLGTPYHLDLLEDVDWSWGEVVSVEVNLISD